MTQNGNLQTVRLNLRPVRDADLISLTAAVNNPRIVRNLMRVPWPYDLDDARSFYEHTLELPRRSAVLAIALRASDQLIGVIGYEGEPDAELGYWLDEAYWGKGIISEAASAVVHQAFRLKGIERLHSGCIIGNEASRKVLVKLGFRPMGVSSVYSGVRRSYVIIQKFELTSREWHLGICKSSMGQ